MFYRYYYCFIKKKIATSSSALQLYCTYTSLHMCARPQSKSVNHLLSHLILEKWWFVVVKVTVRWWFDPVQSFCTYHQSTWWVRKHIETLIKKILNFEKALITYHFTVLVFKNRKLISFCFRFKSMFVIVVS